MKYLLGFFVLALSTQVFATTQPCENYAKSAAIKAYQSKGPIQGSEGIQYSAVLERATNPYLYTVTIADNNEDGDTWEIDYEVEVKQIGKSCKILLVQEVASRD